MIDHFLRPSQNYPIKSAYMSYNGLATEGHLHKTVLTFY